MEKKQGEAKIDKVLISISVFFVILLVVLLYTNPKGSQEVANIIFSKMTSWFGSFTLLFTFLGFVLLVAGRI